jgi:phage baseplate assembly protein W
MVLFILTSVCYKFIKELATFISIYTVATIDLNNLIRPKQTNYLKNSPSVVIQAPASVYTDLRLDLTPSNSVGLGLNVAKSNDIIVDTDYDAIKNSIKNIFTTRPGQKLLTPDFGSSLEKYLFEPITDSLAKIIGNEILGAITTYEPRIDVLNIRVTPQPDLNQYSIQVIYSFLELKTQNTLSIIAQLGGQILI